jgi:GNAT superfamily N-acetyltransferase
MIRLCDDRDFEQIFAIINDGAQAYKGIIPPDRWEEPYMPHAKLRHEIDDGVIFWAWQEHPDSPIAGVMGLQQVRPQGSPPVTLIRHAYVRTTHQKQGIGAKLLTHLRQLADTPVLIGTWADATWAIRFYQRYGFEVVPPDEKNTLLKQYWNVPERQIETSVVLADQRWRDTRELK